jgi:hypothetical protein
MKDTAPQDCLEEIWRIAGTGTDGCRNRDDTTLLLVSRDRGGGIEVQA